MATNDDHSVTETERATLEELEGSSRVQVFDGEPRTIKLALDAGERIPPHQHPDRQIVLHLLEGRLRLTVGDDDHEVEAGELVRFDGDQEISPEALEESTAVLVLAKRSEE
ncbi:cupin [Natronococcus pandeyae]|uniref:Cupin n=1 Tax=Natronococcus pandeyae TaxID=2055836 RepID=A0A8J8Q3J7_9EURY|nr:cupin domain-containing protein [Natronococcus pandeyae]TYL36465.1 cupin [Natronococcus pandeyae]